MVLKYENMAYNNNNGANNWFGQVGVGQAMQSRPQVAAPTLSQIPGLSKVTGDLSLSENPPKQLFRDTDSAYVRLAKQGGRSDLLRMDQDPLPASHASEQKSLPVWLQKDLMNGDGVNDRKHVNCSQNSNFLPPISETRASYSNTKTSEKTGVSSHHSAKPASRDVSRQSDVAERRRLSRNTAADFHSQGEKPKHLSGQELALVNYNQNHRKIPESSAEFRERFYNQDLKPVLSNAEGRADHNTASKSMPNPTRHVNSVMPGDAAQCQSKGELEDINNGKTQWNNGNDLESSACDTLSRKWSPPESGPSNSKENFAYPGDDDLLNGYNPEKLDARRENFMSDDRYSVSDWSRKTSAEGGRQYNQSELEPDYSGRYPDSGNWQDDQIEPYQQRRPPSPAAAGVSSGPRSSDLSRPEWFQPSPHADGQRDRSIVRGIEDNLDEQYSPTRRRLSGQSSTQRPFADHGYQLPMTTETSSAFSDKQLPAGNRQSPLKSSDQMSSYKGDFQTTHQKQFPHASDNANRMKRSDSMSKLLSFGYLRDAENDPLKNRTPSHPRIDNSYLTDPYRTEYKDKMHSGSGTITKAPQTEPSYVPSLISDPSYRRRKQSVEERPEFFRIGSTDSQSLLTHNSYKPVAEGRSDVFANDRIANTNAVGYGKTKHVPENKPDFFTIGSLDNYLDRQDVQPSGDGVGIMDKLNGYGIAPKSNFRRRKTDFNTPAITKPVKAMSRF